MSLRRIAYPRITRVSGSEKPDLPWKFMDDCFRTPEPQETSRDPQLRLRSTPNTPLGSLRRLSRHSRVCGAARGALDAFAVEVAELAPVSVAENVVFRVVDTAGGAYVLRLHRPRYHGYEALASEGVWTDALRASGIAAPRALRLIHRLTGITDESLITLENMKAFELLRDYGRFLES